MVLLLFSGLPQQVGRSQNAALSAQNRGQTLSAQLIRRLLLVGTRWPAHTENKRVHFLNIYGVVFSSISLRLKGEWNVIANNIGSWLIGVHNPSCLVYSVESPLIIINDDDLPLSLLALHSTSTEREEAYAQQPRNPADLLDKE